MNMLRATDLFSEVLIDSQEEKFFQGIESMIMVDECSLTTSLNVVKEVMNVPDSALKSILRTSGYDENIDPSSICITKEMLEKFAEAYIRKAKCYFTNSIRHTGNLTLNEKQDLEEFYELFKKEESDYQLRSWEQIDVSKIRDVFYERIRELTPNRLLKSQEIFDGLISCAQKEFPKPTIRCYKRKVEVLERAHLSAYACRKVLIKKIYDVCSSVRIYFHNIYIAARMYIYSMQDDDEHSIIPI